MILTFAYGFYTFEINNKSQNEYYSLYFKSTSSTVWFFKAITDPYSYFIKLETESQSSLSNIFGFEHVNIIWKNLIVKSLDRFHYEPQYRKNYRPVTIPFYLIIHSLLI